MELQDLTSLMTIHDSLMPHQVATATGCTLAEAETFLGLMDHYGWALAFRLVYHNEHPDVPILVIGMTEKRLPELPLSCSICEAEINDPDELSYGLLFKLVKEAGWAG